MNLGKEATASDVEDFRACWVEGILSSEIAEAVAAKQGARIDHGDPDPWATTTALAILAFGLGFGFAWVGVELASVVSFTVSTMLSALALLVRD